MTEATIDILEKIDQKTSSGSVRKPSKVTSEREQKFNDLLPKQSEKNRNSNPFKFGNYTVTKDGLYYHPPEQEDEDELEGETDQPKGKKKKKNSTDPLRICSPIWPEAYLRNKDGKDHSLLLRVYDGEREHFWAMPKRLITKINDINEVLLDYGQDVPIYQKEKNLLLKFLMTVPTSKKLRCVDKSGWHENQYIFPDGRVIGPSENGEGVYPLNDICPRGVEVKGTLQEWQENILPLCFGNTRLIFSIGTAFAALCQVDDDSGVFNLKGSSSIGKTKCLRAAISVIGGREYQRSWRTTANGLEGVCSLHNDSLLPLDEFGQQDADEAGEIAYTISGGVGKQRSSRDGSPRDPKTWRVLVLSTGEVGLSAHMKEGRKKIRAGQLARVADIPADAGKGLGCFDNVHHLGNGGNFADELDRLCNQYYGTAARAFVEKIANNGIENARKEIRFSADDFASELSDNHDGQVKRVARRFGLVYAALILATKLGITPGLSEEEIRLSVKTCFKDWLADRGTGGALESHSLIEQVIGALNESAESKFVHKNATADDKRIRNVLWGYREGAVFYVLPKAFNEICAGFDNPAKILIEEGLLIPGADRSAQSLRISAHYKKKDRFYVINLDYKNDEVEDA